MTLRHWAAAAVLVQLTALPRAAVAQTTAPPQSQPAGTKIDVSRGGVTISSGVNSLTIGARAQFRWTLEDREQVDADTVGAGVGRADGAASQFDVPRMRVTLSGGAFRPWLRYTFQFDFSRTGGEGASKIKDAMLEIRPTDSPYRVAAGQFKVPFGLQQLTSSGRLQFVDRAITDAKFNPGRDMGVVVGATAAGGRVAVEGGVFNGAGESIRQSTRAHLWVARATFDPFGPYTLSEGATEPVPRPQLHVGAAVRGGKAIRGRTPASVFEEADNQTAVNLEFAYRTARFYSTAESFWMTDEQQNPTPGPDIRSHGFHAQAGYMLVARTLEVGLLVARIDADTRRDDAALREIRGVVGYYVHGHSLKIQADMGEVGYGANFVSLSSRARQGLPPLGTRLVAGTSLSDLQLRAQLQLAF